MIRKYHILLLKEICNGIILQNVILAKFSFSFAHIYLFNIRFETIMTVNYRKQKNGFASSIKSCFKKNRKKNNSTCLIINSICNSVHRTLKLYLKFICLFTPILILVTIVYHWNIQISCNKSMTQPSNNYPYLPAFEMCIMKY